MSFPSSTPLLHSVLGLALNCDSLHQSVNMTGSCCAPFFHESDCKMAHSTNYRDFTNFQHQQYPSIFTLKPVPSIDRSGYSDMRLFFCLAFVLRSLEPNVYAQDRNQRNDGCTHAENNKGHVILRQEIPAPHMCLRNNSNGTSLILSQGDSGAQFTFVILLFPILSSQS